MLLLMLDAIFRAADYFRSRFFFSRFRRRCPALMISLASPSFLMPMISSCYVRYRLRLSLDFYYHFDVSFSLPLRFIAATPFSPFTRQPSFTVQAAVLRYTDIAAFVACLLMIRLDYRFASCC